MCFHSAPFKKSGQQMGGRGGVASRSTVQGLELTVRHCASTVFPCLSVHTGSQRIHYTDHRLYSTALNERSLPRCVPVLSGILTCFEYKLWMLNVVAGGHISFCMCLLVYVNDDDRSMGGRQLGPGNVGIEGGRELGCFAD